MWKPILKWSILVLLLAYVAVISAWAAQEAARHVCTGIEVEILADRGEADSIAAAGLRTELKKFPKKLVGAPVNTINTLDVERYLSKFNTFESVNCLLTPDNKLKIVAIPMIPELRVFDSKGNSYYVNKDGKHIDADARFFVDVPVVQGDFSKAFPATSILPLVRFVNADPELRPLVVSYKADSPENIYLVSRLSGHLINFGDTTHMAEKRQAIMTAYHMILPRMGWDTYDTISVKFRDQVICSRRDKGGHTDYSAEEETEDMEEATLNGIEIAEMTEN